MKYNRYLHAWDYQCKHYLQWLLVGSRKIEALLCPDCGQQYPVVGKSAYMLMGGKMALAAAEAPKKSTRRG